jgi:hypothetical protein
VLLLCSLLLYRRRRRTWRLQLPYDLSYPGLILPGF